MSSLMSKQKLPSYLHSNDGEKLLVVLGTTGAGKSRLSIDLATRFSGEIINSDKMQVYRGLDVLTNKVTEHERRRVPHHLLGVVDPTKNFTAEDFCRAATEAIESISARGQLPIIAGGSNSFVEALMECPIMSTYDVCFLWVDVVMQILHAFLSERVDKMVEQGMVEEARAVFNPNNWDYSAGIRKSIGVGEFHRYFLAEAAGEGGSLLKEAIDNVKLNTRVLASRQLEKIRRLRDVRGWKVHRLDATEVFRVKAAGGGDKEREMWENLVVGPSATVVRRFLLHNRFGPLIHLCGSDPAATPLDGHRRSYEVINKIN